MTYTPEQLREEATQLERENCDVMKVDQRTQIALLRAHAAALEENARVRSANEHWHTRIEQEKALRQQAEAALAESERKCERLKFHAEAMREILLAQLVNQGSHLYEWREETEVALASHRAEFKEES